MTEHRAPGIDPSSAAEKVIHEFIGGGGGLVLDLPRIRTRAQELVRYSAGSGVRLLHTVKASSHPDVLAMAAETGLGFDVTNRTELGRVPGPAGSRFVSVTPTTLSTPEISELGSLLGKGEIQRLHLDSPDQVETYCRETPPGPIGLRLNFAPDAWGDGTRARRFSRFGIRDAALAAVAALVEGSGHEVAWLHLHNASEENDAESFAVALRLMTERAALFGGSVRGFNLGGGLPGRADAAEIGELLRSLRAAAPAEVDLTVEPGRWWSRDAGYLVAEVLDVKAAEKCVFVVVGSSSESRRWSVPTMPSWSSYPGADGLPYVVAGCSAFEQDFLGQVSPRDGYDVPKKGDWVVLGGISSYSLELSTRFNGLSTPQHVVVGE
jgi:diaminopimelate decarboxylase